MARCRADAVDPYDWMVDAIPPTIRSVVDIGCGSAPLHGRIGDRTWVGVDRSAAELAAARNAGAHRLVLGDATRLGLRSDLGAAALGSMALMVATPVAAVIAEICRVVGRDGRLIALLPTTGPLTSADRMAYGRLIITLRERPRFPDDDILKNPAAVLAAAGMVILADDARRFEYPVREPTDAQRFVDSLYLRRAGPGRRSAAARGLARRGRGIGVAFRRVVARPGP